MSSGFIRPLNIAVYFSGHFRNLDSTWNQYKLLFKNTELFQFEFYFGLWDIKDVNDNTKINEENIRTLCPSVKNIIILDSTVTHDLKYSHLNQNIVNQMYSLYKTFELIPNTYDYYIRIRTDLYFFDFDILNAILDLALNMQRPNLLISSTVWYQKKNYPADMLFNDFLWIADYETSKYIVSLYIFMTSYDSTFLENLMSIHLSQTNLAIKHFSCMFNLDRRTRGKEMHLIESQELTSRRTKEGDFLPE